MRRTSLLLLLLFIAGCGAKDSAASCSFKPGDLVITEIMANPAGADTGKEWFEIENNTAAAADLTGLTLLHSKNDGTGAKTHVMTAQTLGPGGYLALGGVAQDLKPGYIGYGFGSDLGALRNDNGLIALKCGSTIIDQVTYVTTTEGASLELDGAMTPSASGNDDPTAWCAAKVLYDGTNAGTPGMVNETCTGGNTTTCMDNGTPRAIVPPGPGDLVIDEIQADPTAVADAQGEWFEVAVLADVDLNGLQLGTMDGSWKDTVAAPDCLRYPAGSFALFAHTDTDNGGLPALAGTFSFTLSNSGGTVAVGHGGTLIDQATYLAASAGTAWQLDPTMLDPAANDDGSAFCKATTTYGSGSDKGTPGAANTSCGTIPTGDMCLDGDVMRAVVKPKPGDLVITEVMADPTKVADSAGEWFEVLATADVDLNGVGIGASGAAPKATVTSTTCVHAAKGSYLVFADNGDSGMNGGLPKVDVAYTGFSLVNGGATFALSIDGTLLDAATYAAASAGASWSLDPSKLDTTSNDTATSFCLTPAGTTYGLGDRGTPGAANPSCP